METVSNFLPGKTKTKKLKEYERWGKYINVYELIRENNDLIDTSKIGDVTIDFLGIDGSIYVKIKCCNPYSPGVIVKAIKELKREKEELFFE